MKGLLFAWYNHNLWQGKDMNFIHFFLYLLSKILAIYVKAALRVLFFYLRRDWFKMPQSLTALLSVSHARLGGYNIWETLGSFSRLGRFLNESPAAASPSNCNMCLHTVILMKGNDGVHFNDVEFKDCLLFQRKAIFFHGNMSLSFFFFFSSRCNFIWETDTEG